MDSTVILFDAASFQAAFDDGERAIRSNGSCSGTTVGRHRLEVLDEEAGACWCGLSAGACCDGQG